MRKSLFLIASFLVATLFVSCAKEEFAANKGSQISNLGPAVSTTLQSCAQHTLIKPKVDILLLWDNSSSALFITPSTKMSFNQLITSVSENFDYHILSAPLISTNASNTLYEASLVAKDVTGVSGSATGILKTKEAAATSLSFSQVSGSAEPGVDRATSIIENNRTNGIFRNDAYTIIVVMSNGDDTSCEITTGYNTCATADWTPRMQPKIDKLLCLRGNVSGPNCSGITPLNSTMMRFFNISQLTLPNCPNGTGKVNTRYRKVAKTLYETPYTNGWPTSNDNLNPFVSGNISYPDNYDICSIDFGHIFDGVNLAIQQTVVHHKYDYWPVATSSTSVDPDTLRVSKIDVAGSITDLINNSSMSFPSNGFKYIGDQINHSTRFEPTVGENFSGKMIQLYGPNQLTYPDCLKVTFTEVKSNFGYIYLKNGEPSVSTIEVKLNGNIIPNNASNGWSYMGLQLVQALDTANYKMVDYPYSTGAPSGYFLKLNGTAQFSNSTSNTIEVHYISAGH